MKHFLKLLPVFLLPFLFSQCGQNSSNGALSNTSGAKTYVPPGQYDEFYAFLSGGYSGQLSVYGLPSGRLFRVIPVFSQDPEKAYGYNEETKPMLNTSHGFVPWDDAHHPHLSQTAGIPDGRWIFINGNNTPRIARIDLTTFETVEIIEIPNSGGNHCSSYVTMNTEYVIGGTRFSVPIPQKDIPLSDYRGNFKGTITFVSVGDEGEMDIAFQILVPGYGYDLVRAGKGVSHGWAFFTTYNSEEANSLLEINASRKDKDFIAAINWKRAEEHIAAGNFNEMPANYVHNVYSDKTHMATSETRKSVKILNPADAPGIIYFMPTPKSPHGVDLDPSGEYIVGNGKLSADLTVHSFSKMIAAIEAEDYEKEIEGIPVLNFESTLAGVVVSGGLGPLHTEFDGKGNGYTTFFISSEIVKWKVGTWEILDRIPTYYSVGHLMIPGGGTVKPWGKYMVAMNKITKDRYLPTGPELAHSSQLFDISGEKMELILDFPTIGEPHYANALPADLVAPNSTQFFRIDENEHPYHISKESEARVEREGKIVHVYMSTIRSHMAPDNIEGIKVGDEVYFHVTNLEQDWDVPHGFAIMGANNSELLIMPGQTETLLWKPKRIGIFPMYCTDFCSALHQEMQGYVRVSSKDSDTPLKSWLGDEPDM